MLASCNPAEFWINGNEEEKFSFEPGEYPWVFQLRGNHYIPMTGILFADDPDHVKRILADMWVFRMKCCEKYLKYQETAGRWHHHEQYRGYWSELAKILTGLPSDMVLSIEPFQKTRMYETGFASRWN